MEHMRSPQFGGRWIKVHAQKVEAVRKHQMNVLTFSSLRGLTNIVVDLSGPAAPRNVGTRSEFPLSKGRL